MTTAAVILAAVGVLVLARLAARPRFAAVIADGYQSVRVIDSEGRILWTRSGIRPTENFVPIRLDRSGRRVLAAALGDRRGLPRGEERESIHLLDPETGGEVGRLRLEDSGIRFPGFADLYTREIQAFDVDQDGLDEIVVTYLQVPYWPSFNLLCEPSLGRCRTLFLASGHHRPLGLADVDGDGRAEIVFGGINNRMGWFNGVAAVRVEPWIGDTGTLTSGGIASSPDEIRSDYLAQTLAWYVLAPTGTILVHGGAGGPADQSGGEIGIRMNMAQTVRIGVDGFLTSDRSELSPAHRLALRREAYDALRETNRRSASEQPRAAIEAATLAVERAREANDAILLEWCRRQQARVLLEAGRSTAGETLFDDLMEGASDAPGVAWEAARAFHLMGSLDEAVRWYERGLAADRDTFAGRFTREFVEGMVFALGEEGRWSDARSAIDRWSRTFGDVRGYAPVLDAWIRWRTGELEPGERSEPGQSGVDFQLYVSLELRATAGEPARDLFAAVRTALDQSSESRPLLRSLEAELLARIGQDQEARIAARDALEAARDELATNLYVRANLPVIEERAARLGR